MEYYSVIKENEILPCVTTWRDLEGILVSQISQKEKGKCCMISLIQTHRYREQMGGCQRGSGGGSEMKGIKRYKPP